jgi:hypothetical protein
LTGPVERELLDAEGGLAIKFVVHIKVFSASWSPAYSLTLRSVAIERIDIAESRLFDVEQEVERIASCRMLSPPMAHLDVAVASTPNQQVSWKPASSALTEVDNGTKVRVLLDGVFLVAMHISHTVNGYNYFFQLLKDDQVVFRCSVPYCQERSGYVSVS